VLLVVIPEVVFCPVPTVFHGLKVGFGGFFRFWFAFDIDAAVAVFIAATVAAEASSVSLLFMLLLVLMGAFVVLCDCVVFPFWSLVSCALLVIVACRWPFVLLGLDMPVGLLLLCFW